MTTRTGTPGNDDIHINDDNVEFSGVFGNEVDLVSVDAGDGDDQVKVDGEFIAFEAEINTGDGNDRVELAGDIEVEEQLDIDTGNGADRLVFSERFQSLVTNIDTGAGDDVLETRDGAAPTGLIGGFGTSLTVRLGEGDDTATFGSGVPIGTGDPLLIDGGGGDDTIRVQRSRDLNSNDEISGGAGNDDIEVRSSGSTGVRVTGGDGNDQITLGDSGRAPNRISESGNEFVVDGGDGDDDILLESEEFTQDFTIPGASLSFAGRTISRPDITGTETDEASRGIIDGGADSDSITTGDGDDVIRGSQGDDGLFGGNGNDDLDGGEGNDRLFGGAGRDQIRGGQGNDQLSGDIGNDDIDGGAGNDRLLGGVGDDTIRTGTGTDLVSGGRGADTFVFGQSEGTTQVIDFNVAGGDRVDVSGLGLTAEAALGLAKEEDRPFFDNDTRQFLNGRESTVIEAGGTEIVLRGTGLDDLNADAFIGVEEEVAVA